MVASFSSAVDWVATNATTQTVTLPTHAAGDMLLVIAACKAATITSTNFSITTPASGWSLLGQLSNGSTAAGNGTGSVRQGVWYREAAGSAETNPVVTWGGSQTAAPGLAASYCFSKGGGDTWVTPVLVQTTGMTGTSVSVTPGDTVAFAVDDIGLCALCSCDDSAITVPTWTAAGLTLGTAVVTPTTPIASATSNDMAASGARRTVTAGSATIAPTITATQAASETGMIGFVRLRTTAGGGGGGAVEAPYVGGGYYP